MTALASRRLTAINGLICVAAAVAMYLNPDRWLPNLALILLAAQCEVIRAALRTSERERLHTAGRSS